MPHLVCWIVQRCCSVEVTCIVIGLADWSRNVSHLEKIKNVFECQAENRSASIINGLIDGGERVIRIDYSSWDCQWMWRMIEWSMITTVLNLDPSLHYFTQCLVFHDSLLSISDRRCMGKLLYCTILKESNSPCFACPKKWGRRL